MDKNNSHKKHTMFDTRPSKKKPKMKNNNRSSNKTRVFTRYRASQKICPLCKNTMLRMVKISDGNIRTQNFIYICNNPNCLQKSDIDQLKKSGWEPVRG